MPKGKPLPKKPSFPKGISLGNEKIDSFFKHPDFPKHANALHYKKSRKGGCYFPSVREFLLKAGFENIERSEVIEAFALLGKQENLGERGFRAIRKGGFVAGTDYFYFPLEGIFEEHLKKLIHEFNQVRIKRKKSKKNPLTRKEFEEKAHRERLERESRGET
ncbi:MAG: hypothetical protein ABIA76_01055 [Candidatus Diapherotrites archaeon]